MKTRYTVSLCQYSHEILLHFLQGARLYLILGIVNDHLKIEVDFKIGLPRFPLDTSFSRSQPQLCVHQPFAYLTESKFSRAYVQSPYPSNAFALPVGTHFSSIPSGTLQYDLSSQA